MKQEMTNDFQQSSELSAWVANRDECLMIEPHEFRYRGNIPSRVKQLVCPGRNSFLVGNEFYFVFILRAKILYFFYEMTLDAFPTIRKNSALAHDA